MKKFLFSVFIAIILFSNCKNNVHDGPDDSGDPNGGIEEPKVYAPADFTTGVNFSGWLDGSSPGAINFSSYSKQDFVDVKSMEAGIIRLPLSLHSMAASAPDYTLDSMFLGFVDQAIDWAEEVKIYLVLDNHSFSSTNGFVLNTANEAMLTKVWEQMAERYKDRSSYIMYEILNEPHNSNTGMNAGTYNSQWGEMQGRVLDAIRAIDDKHSIIAGGGDYNSLDAMAELPKYNHSNIIYTWHFYDPFLFTHQGETWSNNPPALTLSHARNIPFPYSAAQMPAMPSVYESTDSSLNAKWIRDLYTGYPTDGTTAALAGLFDKADNFAKTNNVTLFAGEYGALMLSAKNEDRVRWYKHVNDMLAERGIARTIWGYSNGYGIFNTDMGGSIQSDLNVEIARAIGLNPPEQKAPAKINKAFVIYGDNAQGGIISQTGVFGGELNLNHNDGGNTVISYGNADAWQRFDFVFRNVIDWQYLRNNNFKIKFRARTADGASQQIIVQLWNYETSGWYPWRMTANLSPSSISGSWAEYTANLNPMTPANAWSNLENRDVLVDSVPGQTFSWDKIASMAFLAPGGGIPGTIYLDNIRIEQ